MREGGGHHELTNNRSKESDRCQNGWIYVVFSAGKKGEKICIEWDLIPGPSDYCHDVLTTTPRHHCDVIATILVYELHSM